MGAGHAAIVGAGIGGLAAGIALARAGWEATVYEAAAEFEPLGAGISIWPNGFRALCALGLRKVADRGVRTGGALRRADGSALVESSAEAIQTRFGDPLVGMHRAELHTGLIEALGVDRIHFGKRLVSYEHGELRFADGSTERFDLVVGADGIDSTMRRFLLGDGEPRDSGLIGFRGVAQTDREVPVGGWWGPGTAGGLLQLPHGKVYWYVTFKGEPEADVLQKVACDYGLDFKEVVGLTSPKEVLVHRLHDRVPVNKWSQGVSTLLGDAAHPMLPFLGQGACAALEDAVCLGEALATSGSVGGALKYYESTRWKPTAELVRRSRRAGKVIMLRSGVQRRVRDAVISGLPDEFWLRRFNSHLLPARSA